jgi:hypothetical protein
MRRELFLGVRLSEAELASIENAAARAGVSLSRWTRFALDAAASGALGSPPSNRDDLDHE